MRKDATGTPRKAALRLFISAPTVTDTKQGLKLMSHLV